VIDPSAVVDPSVEVGPGAVIGPNVRIGANTVIGPYAVIESNTSIGRRNRIYQFASLGTPPQDLKYKGEPSWLEIGDDNQIFEFTTLHRGTEGGGMVTRIGNHTFLMNYVHIAHDCQVGDHVVVANSSGIAGHCVLEEWSIVEGMCGVHQFCRIGTHAILAAGSKVAQDVPPYSMVAGPERARLVGVNVVGLERRDFKPETIAALKAAVRTLFYSKLIRAEAIAKALDESGDIPEVRRLVEFVQHSTRGVVGRERE
jgi:UDP-N-acetylglucosamine acyltransferase